MTALVKIKAASAMDICQHYEVEEEIQGKFDPNLAPDAFIKLLLDQKQFGPLVRFLSHALPKREAVWWACIASRSSLTGEEDPKVVAALNAAEQWVKAPTEENRRLAERMAKLAGTQSAAAWAATAAFWSTGSLTKENEPPVPPPAFLYAHAVAGAIMLAANAPDPEQAPAKIARHIQQGLDLARGGSGQV